MRKRSTKMDRAGARRVLSARIGRVSDPLLQVGMKICFKSAGRMA